MAEAGEGQGEHQEDTAELPGAEIANSGADGVLCGAATAIIWRFYLQFHVSSHDYLFVDVMRLQSNQICLMVQMGVIPGFFLPESQEIMPQCLILSQNHVAFLIDNPQLLLCTQSSQVSKLDAVSVWQYANPIKKVLSQSNLPSFFVNVRLLFFFGMYSIHADINWDGEKRI